MVIQLFQDLMWDWPWITTTRDKTISLGFLHNIFYLITKSRMILRNHTYLKEYKCWRILPILKIPTIIWLAIFFKKYFHFQGFYTIYIIIWRFLGWKMFTPSKLGETGLQKMQNGEYFFGEEPLKIAHGIKFAPKIILDTN